MEGFRIGAQRAASAAQPIVMRMLVTAMRQAARSVAVAECAIRWRDAGVVGFDIAGPEAGYRPTRHLEGGCPPGGVRPDPGARDATPAHLDTMAAGLRESRSWDDVEIARYLDSLVVP